MKILIVGGGIAGLAIAWRLAHSGCDVEIVERGIAGRASTWAAAGMLATAAETIGSQEAHTHLAYEGRAMWPEFAASLEQASGCRIGFRQLGSLLVAHDEARAHDLRLAFGARGLQGTNAVWLSPAEARRHEPGLSATIVGALYAPDDAQVDNRLLGDALATAFRRAGGRLRETCEVRTLHIAGRVRGVVTSEGTISADCVILASGAWTSLIGGMLDDAVPPVRPAKGQMMALKAPEAAALPKHLIWSDDVYLVPRPREGVVFVGATVEDFGFDTSVDRETRERLRQGARKVMPALSQWEIAGHWAGLRPRTPDSAPVLGATAIPGLFVASGQFRNGILFAPAIADRMRRAVLGEDTAPLAEAFDPRRFAKVEKR